MRRLLILLLFPTLLYAQSENWVENGSFEDYLFLPRRIEALGVLSAVEAWYQPTGGSADYYHGAAGRECGIPANKLGYQPAYDGRAYCGIYCSKDVYREYLQSELVRPLEAGRTYRLSFYVSLSEYSNVAVATLGALFSAERVTDTAKGILMHRTSAQLAPGVVQTVSSFYQPQVQNAASRRLDSTQRWQRVSGEFVAEGGERFITLGNFCAASQSNVGEADSLTGLLAGAYYYIDSVTLHCLDCVAEPPTQEETAAPSYAVGDVVVLNDLYFDFDKSVILQQSYQTLKQLLDLLNRYPKMRIEIQGHTDSKGSASYNRRLSERRAKAVVDYLTGKGVNPRRLQYKGYGDTQPIATNSTEEGRATNRRVAFIIQSM